MNVVVCEVNAPEGPLCVGQFYELSAVNCGNAQTVNWVLIDGPPGVEEDDIFFTAKQNLTTKISVPFEGDYIFAVEYCEPA